MTPLCDAFYMALPKSKLCATSKSAFYMALAPARQKPLGWMREQRHCHGLNNDDHHGHDGGSGMVFRK